MINSHLERKTEGRKRNKQKPLVNILFPYFFHSFPSPLPFLPSLSYFVHSTDKSIATPQIKKYRWLYRRNWKCPDPFTHVTAVLMIGKFVFELTLVSRLEDVRKGGGISPCILNLDTR
jgi:hypothetical protein